MLLQIIMYTFNKKDRTDRKELINPSIQGGGGEAIHKRSRGVESYVDDLEAKRKLRKLERSRAKKGWK